MTEERLEYLNTLHGEIQKCKDMIRQTFPEFRPMYEKKLNDLQKEFEQA